MTLIEQFRTREAGRARSVNNARAHIGIAEAVTRVVCETLEARQLLATFTYIVPSGNTAAYIQAVPGEDGRVQVRLNSPNNPVVHTFTNDTGLDVVNSGTNNPPGGFLFVDQVWAEDKPTADPSAPSDPFGIKVQGGTNGHLKIEAGPDDDTIRITEST